MKKFHFTKTSMTVLALFLLLIFGSQFLRWMGVSQIKAKDLPSLVGPERTKLSHSSLSSQSNFNETNIDHIAPSTEKQTVQPSLFDDENLCLESFQTSTQISIESLNDLNELYYQLQSRLGVPQLNDILLEEKTVRWVDGTLRTFRWAPDQDGVDGGYYWFNPSGFTNEDLVPITNHDFEHLLEEAPLISHRQSRYIIFNEDLSVGLLLEDKVPMEMAVNFGDYQLLCQQTFDEDSLIQEAYTKNSENDNQHEIKSSFLSQCDCRSTARPSLELHARVQ